MLPVNCGWFSLGQVDVSAAASSDSPERALILAVKVLLIPLKSESSELELAW